MQRLAKIKQRNKNKTKQNKQKRWPRNQKLAKLKGVRILMVTIV